MTCSEELTTHVTDRLAELSKDKVHQDIVLGLNRKIEQLGDLVVKLMEQSYDPSSFVVNKLEAQVAELTKKAEEDKALIAALRKANTQFLLRVEG